MIINSRDVVERLGTLGYNLNEGDITTLELVINGTEQYIKNFCNVSEIPCELHYVAVDMAAGTFLKTKQSIGADVNELIDFNTGDISSIKEGDITIEFNSGNSSSAVGMFNKLTDRLCNRSEELTAFRKMRW